MCRSLFTFILKQEKCFISFLHLTITGAAKHTKVNDIFSWSSRRESNLGLLLKYTVLDSAYMPLLVIKTKFRGEKWGERNLQTKAKQEKPPRFL